MESKILIVLFYYNRPNLVRTALNSIKNHNYSNWEVAFIDDGSEISGKSIVEEIFEDTSNFKFYNTNDTIDDKLNRNGVNGSLMGKVANEAILESDADYVLMLCDDDALYPDYLLKLNQYFQDNLEENYVYSHIKIFDPTTENPSVDLPFRDHTLNKTDTICPFYALDMSQISWRRKPFEENEDIRFPYPFTVNIDAELFLKMYSNWGNIKFSGFIGQYKAIFLDNLSHRMGRVLHTEHPDTHIFNINVK
jgi:glycosyltransferase involved in cell wall biosynthesis